MTPCRTLVALYGLSLAFSVLCGLIVLEALYGQHSTSRSALGRHKEPPPLGPNSAWGEDGPIRWLDYNRVN